MRKIILFFTLLIININSFATDPDYWVKHSPDYMLPSTEAISRIKHIARPPALYTGIPKINIPLWNNKMCSYSMNLEYYAGGIQVSELGSSVGLGWSLKAGGAIYRIVRGFPDDLADKGYLSCPDEIKDLYNNDLDLMINQDAQELNNIGDQYDSAPDLFYYEFNGIKGSFIFDLNGNIVPILKTNLKITADINELGEINGFIIRTSDGIKYNFDVPEEITINSINGENTDVSSIIDTTYSSYISAWYLSNGTNISDGKESYQYEQVTLSVNRSLYQYAFYNEAGTRIEDMVRANLTIERPRLISASDKNSITKFNYGSNNELISIEVSGIIPSFADPVISEVLNIRFNYGTFTSASTDVNRIRKLISVEYGSENSSGEFILFNKYDFEYNEDLDIPAEYSTQQDLWGYYKANSSSSILLPEMQCSNGYYESLVVNPESINLSGANRITDPASIQVGLLNKIITMQGGETEYFYGAQSFMYGGKLIQGGGARIDSIKYDDPDSDFPGTVIKYNYTNYDEAEQSTGVLIAKPNFAYDLKYHESIPQNTFHYAKLTHGLNMPFGIPVYYKQVTVDNGFGYTVSDYEMPVPNSSYMAMGIDFQDDTSLVYEGYYCTAISYKDSHFKINYSYGLRPYLIRKRSFGEDNTIIHESILTYEDVQNEYLVAGFKCSPRLHKNLGDPISDTRTLHKFFYPVAWKLLESKQDINYENGSSFDHLTEYSYSDYLTSFRLVTETSWYDTDGNKHIKEVKYPFSFSVDGYTLSSDIQQYNEEVEQTLTSEDYKTYLPDGLYYLKKGINPDILPPENTSISNASKNTVGLITLWRQKNYTIPVEVIEWIEIDGQKRILSSTLRTFKKLPNQKVVPHIDYEYNGPTSFVFPSSDIINDIFKVSKNYEFAKEYVSYNEDGNVTKTRSANGLEIDYAWTEQGTYLKSKTFNSTNTEYYSYKPLVGLISQTDVNGNEYRYIYDISGKLVAKTDQSNNIKEINTRNYKNGLNDIPIDQTTDPNGVFGGTNLPQARIDSYNEYKELFIIAAFNPAFQYEMDFGDGTTEIIERSSVMHHYTEVGTYTVVLKEALDGIVVNQDEITITLGPEQ
ncbi:MAG: hypothetical protein KQH79_12835 [Bacteroidetes bacterium]|nr:hypothetical protein [Bacteroidota bacterium]